jgi:hypothetical protein
LRYASHLPRFLFLSDLLIERVLGAKRPGVRDAGGTWAGAVAGGRWVRVFALGGMFWSRQNFFRAVLVRALDCGKAHVDLALSYLFMVY